MKKLIVLFCLVIFSACSIKTKETKLDQESKMEWRRKKQKSGQQRRPLYTFYSDDETHAFTLQLDKKWKACENPQEFSAYANASLYFNDTSLLMLMVSYAADYEDFESFIVLDDLVEGLRKEPITIGIYQGVRYVYEFEDEGQVFKVALYKIDMGLFYMESATVALESEYDERIESTEKMLESLQLERVEVEEFIL